MISLLTPKHMVLITLLIIVNSSYLNHLIINVFVGHAGFTTSKVACCGQGAYNGIGLCTPLSNLCPNRNVYAFWDPFHPSEKASKLVVEQIMSGSKRYMNPMNLSTILALDATTWHENFHVSLFVFWIWIWTWFQFVSSMWLHGLWTCTRTWKNSW